MALTDVAAETIFPYPATDTQNPLCRIFSRVTEIAKKKPGKTQQESICNAFHSMELLSDQSDMVDFKISSS